MQEHGKPRWVQNTNSLNGIPVSAEVPTTGEALVFDGAKWAPGAGGGGGSFLPLAGGTLDAAATLTAPAIANSASATNPHLRSVIRDVAGSIVVNTPRHMVIVGNHLHVTSHLSDAFEILDISNLSAPTHVGVLTHGTGGALLDGPRGIAISGIYAFVVSDTSDSLEVINISNPAAPTHAASLVHGAGGALLDGAHKIALSGNYAYIVSLNSSALEVVDISNPLAPVHAASLANGVGGALLGGATDITISGNYAYICASTSDALEIVDISNPLAPVHAASLANGVGGALLDRPQGVVIVGNYAYVCSSDSDALEIIDISNPLAPTHASSIVHGAGGAILDNPIFVRIRNGYAYVTSNLGGGALEIINVSNPLAPVHVKAIPDGYQGAILGAPQGIEISGNTLFVGSNPATTGTGINFTGINIFSLGGYGPLPGIGYNTSGGLFANLLGSDIDSNGYPRVPGLTTGNLRAGPGGLSIGSDVSGAVSPAVFVHFLDGETTFRLGDTAGVKKLRIKDSAGVEQFSLNSDGTLISGVGGSTCILNNANNGSIVALNYVISNSSNQYLGADYSNISTGTAAGTQLVLRESGSGLELRLRYRNSGLTPNGLILPNQGTIITGTGTTNGILTVSNNVSGPLVYAVGGTATTNERFRIADTSAFFTTKGNTSASTVKVKNSSGTDIFSVDGAGSVVHTAGTLAAGQQAFTFTCTMPNTSNTDTAVIETYTSAGTGTNFKAARSITFAAGFTDAADTLALSTLNSVAGTGTTLTLNTPNNAGRAKANIGAHFRSNATTVGYNIGAVGTCENGFLNIGLLGKTVSSSPNTNIGVLGNGANASAVNVGGYFSISSPDEPTFTSAALIADNGTGSSPIFLARDNGSVVFTIADGGAVTAGATTVSSLTDSGLTAARVPYAGTGGLLQDSTNFIWDNANARLGIGANATTPTGAQFGVYQYPLDMAFSGNKVVAASITNTDAVGNFSASSFLCLEDPTLVGKYFRFQHTNTSVNIGGGFELISGSGGDCTSSGRFTLISGAADGLGDMIFATAGAGTANERMRITYGGEVDVTSTLKVDIIKSHTPSGELRLSRDGGAALALRLFSDNSAYLDLFDGAGASAFLVRTDAGVTRFTVGSGGAVSVGSGGTFTSPSITDSGLTSGRVVTAGASGLLQDSANLTFNGTDLTVSGAMVSGSATIYGSPTVLSIFQSTTDSTAITANSATTFDVSAAVPNSGQLNVAHRAIEYSYFGKYSSGAAPGNNVISFLIGANSAISVPSLALPALQTDAHWIAIFKVTTRTTGATGTGRWSGKVTFTTSLGAETTVNSGGELSSFDWTGTPVIALQNNFSATGNSITMQNGTGLQLR